MKQHRWPLRGTKRNHRLSASRSAEQDARAAAPPCETEVTGWGARGAAVDAHGFRFPRLPRGSKARGGRLLRSRDSHSFALAARLSQRQLRTPRGHNGALSGAGRRWPLVTVLTPGTRSQRPPLSWITASSLLRAFAQGCCPRLLKENLTLCLGFFSQVTYPGVWVGPWQKRRNPKGPRRSPSLTIVVALFQISFLKQKLCSS